MKRLALSFLFAFLFLAGPAFGEVDLPKPAPAGSLFKDRPFGPLPPPTPTPERKRFSEEDEKPIPFAWIVGGGVAGAIIIVAVLFGASRRWRSSNLFDRQYRFPIVHDPALRFGAKKCGGHLATVRMSEPLKAKNA